MNLISGMSSREEKLRKAEVMVWYASSLKSTRSILFTQTTRCLMPNSDAMKLCRWVCSTSPCRASIKMMAKSAVDAPVTMLRVYCTCPGVSAMMNFRRGVAK